MYGFRMFSSKNVFNVVLCLICGIHLSNSNSYQIITLYKFRKEQGFDNTVTFSKEGMIDESFYGIKMTFKWEKVLAVVIKKYTITILTDTPAYFYFNITEKNNILKALEKYQVKDKVIDSDFSN